MLDPTLTNEFRRAADIEAASPIAITASHVSPELATAYAALIAHLRAEIDRLTTLHRAEQEHNRRLMAGYGLMRSAYATLAASLISIPKNDYDRTGELHDASIDATRADDLCIPTAKDA